MVRFKKIVSSLLVAFVAFTSLCLVGNAGVTKVAAFESVKLVYYYPGTKQPDEKMVWADLNSKLKPKAGLTVDFRRLDWGQYDSKMQMVIASAENYDICYSANWTNDFKANSSKQAYMDISKYINSKEFTVLKSVAPKVSWDAVSSGNKILGVPSYELLFTQWGYVMTKELADKYKMTNLDFSDKRQKDLEPYLKLIKKDIDNGLQVTNKDGKKSRVLFPFQGFWETQNFFENIAPNVAIRKNETNPLNILPTKRSKEDLETRQLAHDWHKLGYTRRDAATAGDTRGDVSALKYAIWAGGIKPGAEVDLKTQFGIDFVIIPFQKPYIQATAGISSINCISRTSKHPVQALKFLQILNTDKELYNELSYGIEGKHYTKLGNNYIDLVKNSRYNTTTPWMFGTRANAYFLKGQSKDVWTKTDTMNRTAKKSCLLGFVFDQTPVKTEIANVNSILAEYDAAFYMDGWEKKMQECDERTKKAGIDKIHAEAVRQIKAWLALKK